MTASEPQTRLGAAAAWTGVFSLNLPLPLLLGTLAVEHGRAGMWAGVAVLWLAGLATCLGTDRLGKVLVRGGAMVAVLQPLVGLHLMAGFLAVLGWELAASAMGVPPYGPRADLAGFVLTLLTAQPLLLAAWAFGGGPRLLLARPERPTPEQADYG